MKNLIQTSLSLAIFSAAFAACAPAYRAPPLSLAEKCANDGLVAGGTRGAEASGIVGQVFAGSGSTHSCERATTIEQRCEVEANSRSAVAKQTYKAEESQVIAYANDVKWKTYNACMARQPGSAAPAPAPRPAPAPVAPAPAPVAPAPAPAPVAPPVQAPTPTAPVATAPIAPAPVAAPAPMPPAPPSTIEGAYSKHQGFTGGLAIGLGRLSCDNCIGSESAINFGFHLGGFLNPRMALMFESGIWTKDERIVGIYTLSGRYYFSPEFWAKGGLGMGRLSASNGGYDESLSGLGLTGGAGYEIVQSGNFALDLSGHLNILSIENETVTLLSFLVGANWK